MKHRSFSLFTSSKPKQKFVENDTIENSYPPPTKRNSIVVMEFTPRWKSTPRNTKRDAVALDSPLNLEEMRKEIEMLEKRSSLSGYSSTSEQSSTGSRSPRRHSISLMKDSESPKNLIESLNSRFKKLRRMSIMMLKPKKDVEIWEKIAKQMNPLYDKDLSQLEKPFDIANFVIKPTSIFEFQEMADAFYEHLKKEFNTDPWEFINLVDSLNSDVTKENIEKVLFIVDTYIESTGKKSLNLSSKTRTQFLDYFELQKKYGTRLWALDLSIDVLFLKLREIVSQELILDNFPRFSRTETCINIVKKFRNNKNLVSPALTLRFTIPDEFFFNPVITDHDLDFFTKAGQDSFDYELISSTNESIRTYFGVHDYLPKVTLIDDLDVYKYEGILHYPLEHLICSLTLHKDRLLFDPFCHSFQILKHFPHEKYMDLLSTNDKEAIESKRGCCVSSFDYTYQNKHYKNVNATTIDYKPDDRFIICSKPTIDPSTKREGNDFGKHWKESKVLKFVNKETGEEKEKEGHYAFEISMFVYKKVDDQKTHFQQLYFTNVGQGTKQQKKMIVNKRSKSLQLGILEKLKNDCEKNGEFLTIQNYKEKMKSDPLGQMILELNLNKL